MAGSIADNAAIYNKQANKWIQPPSQLIDCSSYALDFADRKFILIGLDPTDSFNIVIQLVTPSRHVCISPDFLRRIYSLMGNILSIIIDTPVKSKERLFLKDETISMSKIIYRGDNMLVIESYLQDGCRVQLSRQNLLTLQDLEGAIHESIMRKLAFVRPAVLKQLEQIASYLKTDFYREKTMSVEDISTFIAGIHNDLIVSHVPKSEPCFISQIKLIAPDQLAQSWAMKLWNETDKVEIIDDNVEYIYNNNNNKNNTDLTNSQLLVQPVSGQSDRLSQAYDVNDGPTSFDYMHY